MRVTDRPLASVRLQGVRAGLRRALVLALGVPLLGAAAPPAAPAGVAVVQDRLAADQVILLEEAARVVREVGDDLWNGWSRAPRATLIVGAETEFLVNVPRGHVVPGGFAPLDQKVLGQRVYARRATLPSWLRTTLSIGDTPTAVVGSWEPAVETPNEWVVTLVEQWFRLLQQDRGEQTRIEHLGDDSEGTPAWRLEHPFPYEDPDVGNAMLLLGQALYDFWARGATLPREGQRTFLAETAWAALQNLRTVLTIKYGDDAYRYFQLEAWRGGVARYSGILAARAIARAEVFEGYRSTRGFDALPERQSYAELWEENISSRFWLMRTSGYPGERDRTSLLALGHGLAELLDAVNPRWKDHYFDPDVWLDDLIAEGLSPERAAVRR